MGCQDADSPAAPAPLPPLEDQVWYVHVSDGQAVPALLGHRLVNGSVLEQDFLDSSRLDISADGSWEHAGWYQRFHDGEWTQSVATLDWGTWSATTAGYEFRRNTGELLYTVDGPLGSDLALNLRYPGQEGVAVSTLRRSPAPPTVVGRWRATTLNGDALPSTYTVDPNVDFGSGPVSRHVIIDSAFVWLYANGRYLQRVYHTEWEGPANGDPTHPIYDATETDFGSWGLDGTAIVLLSGWLENKVITGDVSGLLAGGVRLDHGITHGDPPAPFQYSRW